MSGVGPDSRRWYALALLCTAAFMVILDGTIVLVAVPSIEVDLDLTTTGVQWVASSYALTFGGLLLLGGRAADLLGRRRVLMAGMGLFAAASLLCGLAWSGEVLITGRAIQGVAAAIMTPTALSILLTTFAEGPERNKALGVWGGVGGVGGTAGALIGGPLTDGLGWAWIFFINVPVCVAMLVASPVMLRESDDRARTRTLDPLGAITITGSLVLLVLAVVQAPEAGWVSTRTVGLLGGAAALVALFVLVESRSAAPLVPLRIFRSRTLVGGNLGVVAVGMSVNAMLFILTLYAQQVLGYSAVEFGLFTAGMAFMAIIGSVVGQHFVTRFGFRPVAVTGLGLLASGCLLLTGMAAAGGQLGLILAGVLIVGSGLGSAMVAASIAALAGVVARESGLVSGLTSMAFQIGGALGIAVVATVAASRTSDVLAAAGRSIAPQLALTEGFQSAFGVAAGFAAVGALAAALLLLRPRAIRTEHPEPVATAGP